MRYLAPIPSQFIDETGVPCEGGSVSVYISGETRLANIYQNSHSDELAPNPSKLDSIGMWQAFVDAGVSLDYIVKDKDGNVVAPFYGIVVASGSSAVYSVKGTAEEITVETHTDPSGKQTASVGLANGFKKRMTDAEDGLEDANANIASLQEEVGEVQETLENKKDRQSPLDIRLPPTRTVTRVLQDEDGNVTVESSDIEIPEGAVKKDSLNMSEVYYIYADEKTVHAAISGNEIILSSLDVIVTTGTSYDEVKSIIEGGKHPILEVDGVYYRLIGTAEGSEVEDEPSVSYNFGCFPAETVIALDKYRCKVYNIDVTNGWTSSQLDFYTASKVDSLIGNATAYKFVNTTEQWLADVADSSIRLWYIQNNSVNRASIELNSSHQTLCYIYATLPALEANEAYRLTFEITLTNKYQDLDTNRKCILILDSDEDNYELLCEFAQDGTGGFTPIHLNRLELPFFYDSTVKYKVYVDGHAYRVVRIA